MNTRKVAMLVALLASVDGCATDGSDAGDTNDAADDGDSDMMAESTASSDLDAVFAAAQELAKTAPTSIQAQELEAEAFESRNDWDRATAQYQRILAQDPKTRDIHYRLGRILLSKNPPDTDGAKKQFEEELKLGPNNAPAQYMLGEIARQRGQWDDAAEHFSRASKLDQGFAEAYLALGMSLNSSGKFSDAVAPLQSYVKMVPEDPAGHYQLATAYARTGRKPDAEREMAIEKEAAAKAPRTGDQQ